jgi:peptidoglycan/xylan/chitin deacetylase (PgdA/CDA1 family)
MLKRIFSGNNQIIPVVMFHSVGCEKLDWAYKYISEPVKHFESKIKFLKTRGFSFITWHELYRYMQGKLQLKLPAILLTFDDGYLDNWVNAYPILKKYNAKGTIFVSSDFVDQSNDCRFNLDDIDSGRCTENDLIINGFLNWSEMREMEASGIIDIQSHAASHTWYFKNNKILDFWGPNYRKYPWLPWNKQPSQKPYYMRDNQYTFVNAGTPIYEYEKSLIVRQYIPSKHIEEALANFVEQNGGQDFFLLPEWKEKLLNIYSNSYNKYKSDCRYETDSEKYTRIYEELHKSKEILQNNLNKIIDFICWPGGGYDHHTLDIARKVGYKSWTLGSSDKSNFRNVPGVSAEHIKRIGSSIKQSWRGNDIGFTDGREFYHGVKRHQGSLYNKWAGRTLKALRIINNIPQL